MEHRKPPGGHRLSVEVSGFQSRVWLCSPRQEPPSFPSEDVVSWGCREEELKTPAPQPHSGEDWGH